MWQTIASKLEALDAIFANPSHCLHHDAAGHFRMHAAEIRILSRLVEAELECLVRIERYRFELALRAVDCMRNVVAIDPCHLRTRSNCNRARSKCKIIDLHFQCG